MKLNDFFESYLAFLWETFMYDVSVFSQGWIYYWLLVPAFFYFVFFCIKWSILLFPFWMPLNYVKKGLIYINKNYLKPNKKDETS